MREEGGFRIGKPIDNSRVVRQVDPRSRREILLLILLVIVLGARYVSDGIEDVNSKCPRAIQIERASVCKELLVYAGPCRSAAQLIDNFYERPAKWIAFTN